VIEGIHTKMVRRHPHVFGDAKADTAADVLRNWEVLKAEEKRQNQAEQGKSYDAPKSVLAGVSASIPSLMQAYQLTSRAAHVGFDWKRLEDVLDKLREEAVELEAAAMTGKLPAGDDPQSQAEAHSKIEEEVGDLLFTVVNVARFLKVDPESALRRTNAKFRRRFEWIEAELRKLGKSPRESTLEEMDVLWNRSKETEQEIGL
jgi:MazG family protein